MHEEIFCKRCEYLFHLVFLKEKNDVCTWCCWDIWVQHMDMFPPRLVTAALDLKAPDDCVKEPWLFIAEEGECWPAALCIFSAHLSDGERSLPGTPSERCGHSLCAVVWNMMCWLHDDRRLSCWIRAEKYRSRDDTKKFCSKGSILNIFFTFSFFLD